MLGGEVAGLKPEIEHPAEGHVKEVSGATGGVEDTHGGELVDPCAEQFLRGTVDAETGLFAVASGFLGAFDLESIKNALLFDFPTLT